MGFEISEKAKGIIKDGGIKAKVKRAGMFQFQEFKIRRMKIGNDSFVELWLDNVVNLSEIIKLSEELGLPIETQNGRIFPAGSGAKDFIGL